MNQYEIVEELRNIVKNNIGYTTWTISTPHLVALVNKFVQAEREACAKVCEDYGRAEEMQAIGNDCAAAIRARGETNNG